MSSMSAPLASDRHVCKRHVCKGLIGRYDVPWVLAAAAAAAAFSGCLGAFPLSA